MADIFVDKTAAANSNLGVDVYLIGATRDLAILDCSGSSQLHLLVSNIPLVHIHCLRHQKSDANYC